MDAPRKASSPGVGLAYDVAAQNLARQLSLVDTLNTRLAGVLAATIAVAAISVQSPVHQVVRAVTIVWLMGALAEALRASVGVKWASAPTPQTFARYAGDEPDYMKEIFLPDMLDAISKNKGRLSLKSWRLNWAILYLGLAVFSLVVGKVIADLGLDLVWPTVQWLIRL
jgi:hypothetical protein